MDEEEVSILKTPLPELSRTGESKFRHEEGGIKAEVEILRWEDMDGEGGVQPFVLVQLECHVEDEISSIWSWSTDHYWDYLSTELPDFLQRFCPYPGAVWECLLEAVTV
jgi:hypothetical protein